MVEYATRETLRRFASQGSIEESATIVTRATGRSPAGATFLSHSTKDVDLLPGVIRLLEGHGASVYVDKKDDSLPPFTSRETATALRGRIKECRKFILFATTASKESRWMPWELGLSDGVKLAANVAVLPGVDTASDTAWSVREYLGVYDRIVWGGLQGRDRNVWMVWNREKNTATELAEWIRRY